MLKMRILTAAILMPLVILVIFTFPQTIFQLFCTLFFLYATWEWTNLMGVDRSVSRILLLLLMLIIFSASVALESVSVYFIALAWWLVAFVLIVLYPKATSYWASQPRKFVMGAFLLTPSWSAILYLHENYSPAMLMYFLILIWAADIGAYFAGRQWGKQKLMPLVSPGKTVEGALGGVSLALPVILFGGLYFQVPFAHWVDWMLIAVASVVVSVVGDLLVSMAKRAQGVKDSGSLLPGHGGVLDRIDSICAAAPLFTLGLILFGLKP